MITFHRLPLLLKSLRNVAVKKLNAAPVSDHRKYSL